jgi:aromatic ring-opening dioxygenase LigB subunit
MAVFVHNVCNALLVLSLSTLRVRGIVVGAAVIPHGDFAYDCTLIQCINGSQQVHDSSVAVGQWVASLKPDTVVITTPHGIASTNDYLWYLNHNGTGFALLGQDLHNGTAQEYKVRFNAQLDVNLSQLLINATQAIPRNNVSGLSSFADSEPVALRWGEVIPLSFLGPSVNSSTSITKIMVLSVPTRRYTQDVAMVSPYRSLLCSFSC